ARAAAVCLYCVGVEKTRKVIAADADLGEVPPYTGRGRPPSRPEKVRPGATNVGVCVGVGQKPTACFPQSDLAGGKQGEAVVTLRGLESATGAQAIRRQGTPEHLL